MQTNIPLAERLRPRTLDEYIGQEHLVGADGVFRRFLETGNVPSFILWGPPGVGKTTLARLVATALDRKMFTLSAINAGVKDVREVIEQARKNRFFNTPAPFLFIDEIHRFNKSQQDSLLGAVEQGVFTLIGATTENPSFEVISPLLSRCQVYILKSLEDKDLQTLLDRALTTDTELKERDIEVTETGALFRFSGGDARKLLKAYCDKEPLAKMVFLPEETELAIRTSAGRMLLVGTAQISAKATRDSQGVAVVTLKKNQHIASVVPAETLELANPHRYRVRSLPATGALVRAEDEGEQLSLL